MRLALKRIAYAAPVALFLLLLYRYSRSAFVGLQDQAVLQYPNPDFTSKIEDAADEGPKAPLTNVNPLVPGLWQEWSAIFYHARPQIPALELEGGNALNERPHSEGHPRKPYTNYVRISPSDLVSLSTSHALLVQELETRNVPQNIYAERGVVIVGGGEYYGPAITSIQMLRRSGSTLPVEVFVPTLDEYEPDVCEKFFPRLNARCVILADILSLATGPGSEIAITHYQLKSAAILLSSFAEVLFLDSDSMPLVKPETDLFDLEPYKFQGLVVWPDFWIATESPAFWSIAGLSEFPKDLPMTSSETGQLLINKSTHLKPLLLATYYNIYGPDYYYPLLSQGALGQGDKETFMAAAVVLNSTYYRVQTPVGMLGRDTGKEFRGTAMVQYSPVDDFRAANEKAKSKSNPSSSPPLKDASTNTSAPSSSNSDTPISRVKPAFLHANTPKMNAAHLLDEGDLFSSPSASSPAPKRLRLLGSKDGAVALFGYDIERSIWDILVQTGCELADVVWEWKGRDRMCDRLEEHYEAMFKDRKVFVED